MLNSLKNNNLICLFKCFIVLHAIKRYIKKFLSDKNI
ncbi:MAG: hypothetical protein PWQ54_1362 [Bacteroidales bacterium]|jgi:hypothetical protein|nr:hypothetical protein [Bacteroidales bacterium]